ncbi:hypothetical protein C8F01DRAFT_1148726, partial [Mycena amicta]
MPSATGLSRVRSFVHCAWLGLRVSTGITAGTASQYWAVSDLRVDLASTCSGAGQVSKGPGLGWHSRIRTWTRAQPYA